MALIILLMLPALSLASITINIKATPEGALVTNVGKDSRIISDLEIQSFNLTDQSLKKAVKLHSKGTPIDVFVKGPTPWGDLYKSYEWPEVNRETKVKRVRTLSVTKKPVTVAQKLYTNKLNKEAIFVTNVKQAVVGRISNGFNGVKLSVDVKYNISLEKGVPPLRHVDFVSHLKNNTLLNVFKIMQARDDITFNLRANQSAEVICNATKVTVEVLVEYETRLDGYVAVNYNPRYKGHHFWAYDVRDVMEASGKSSIQKATDLIVVEYYTGAKVVLVDVASGSMMQTADAVFLEE